MICPAGAIGEFLSILSRENISVFRKTEQVYGSRIPLRLQRAYRDRHETWGGDAVDVKALTDERRLLRTAKSCGPGAPMQAPSWR